MGKPIDLTGKQLGRLTVIGLSPEECKRSGRHWLCACDCGATKTFAAQELLRGEAQSCGCLRKETTRMRGQANKKHGAAREGQETPEYRSWVEMRRRCSNPNFIGYEYYGGRGIKVCARWNIFATFLADMGPKPSPSHSIDRVNNDGNYEPSNCRWATKREQANNRRPAR